MKAMDLIISDLFFQDKDNRVYLYYRSIDKMYFCVACKHLNGDGYIITTYLTDRVKEGNEIWKKS